MAQTYQRIIYFGEIFYFVLLCQVYSRVDAFQLVKSVSGACELFVLCFLLFSVKQFILSITMQPHDFA